MEPKESNHPPLIDKQSWGPVYSHSFIRGALIGFAVGALILGYIGWAYSAGGWEMAGIGQFAASGNGVSGFVGAGVGGSLGALIGASIPLFGMVKKRKMDGK